MGSRSNKTFFGKDIYFESGYDSLPFLFGILTFGGFIISMRDYLKIPYITIVFGFGLLIGYVANISSDMQSYLDMSFIKELTSVGYATFAVPLFVMSYVFSMDPRTFKSMSVKMVAVLVVRYVCDVICQGVFVLFILIFYDFPTVTLSQSIGLVVIVGSITSVIGPSITITGLMKLGMNRSLIQLMEAMRIVSYLGFGIIDSLLFMHDIDSLSQKDANFWVKYVVINILCTFISYLFAKIALWWISHVYNDAVLEVTIVVSMCYLACFLPKRLLMAAADVPVLDICILALYSMLLSQERDRFSVGIDDLLEGLLALINQIVKIVVIFIAGFVITMEDFTAFILPLQLWDILMILTFITYIMFAKYVAMLLLWPFRGICNIKTWQELMATATCEYISSLSLVFSIMLYVTIFVVFRMSYGALVLPFDLGCLGLNRVALSREESLKNALESIKFDINSSIDLYSFDRFYCDADWDLVLENINFDKALEDRSTFNSLTIFDVGMENVIDRKNLPVEELNRLHLLHAFKRCFWKQHEHGLLSLNSMRFLEEECDVDEWLGNLEQHMKAEKIQSLFSYRGTFALTDFIQRKFEQNFSKRCRLVKEGYDKYCRTKLSKAVHRIVFNTLFEWPLLIVATLSTIVSIIRFICELRCQRDPPHRDLYRVDDIVNIVYVCLRTVYLLLRVYAIRWLQIKVCGSSCQVIYCVAGCVDLIVNFTYLHDWTVDDYCNLKTDGITLTQFIVHEIFVVHRFFRVIVLLEDRTGLIYQFVTTQMQQRIKSVYDIGKGYITCQEEVFITIDDMITDPKTGKRVKDRLMDSRGRIMQQLAVLQKQHPTIVRSVKSQNAARHIIRNMEEAVNHMRKEGHIDATEADMLLEMLKVRSKKMRDIPNVVNLRSLPKIIGDLPWVYKNSHLIDLILYSSDLIQLAEGEHIIIDAEHHGGLFVVISGLIQVELAFNGAATGGKPVASGISYLDPFTEIMTCDYFTLGCTYGEFSLLSGLLSPRNATCLTSVLLCHIPYESVYAMLDLYAEDCPYFEFHLWYMAATYVSLALLKMLPVFQIWMVVELKSLVNMGTLEVRHLTMPPGHDQDAGMERFYLTPYRNEYITVLLHGLGHSPGNKETFIGPCFIPPLVDSLYFLPVECEMYVLFFVPTVIPITGIDAGAATVENKSVAGQQRRQVPTMIDRHTMTALVRDWKRHHAHNSSFFSIPTQRSVVNSTDVDARTRKHDHRGRTVSFSNVALFKELLDEQGSIHLGGESEQKGEKSNNPVVSVPYTAQPAVKLSTGQAGGNSLAHRNTRRRSHHANYAVPKYKNSLIGSRSSRPSVQREMFNDHWSHMVGLRKGGLLLDKTPLPRRLTESRILNIPGVSTRKDSRKSSALLNLAGATTITAVDHKLVYVGDPIGATNPYKAATSGSIKTGLSRPSTPLPSADTPVVAGGTSDLTSTGQHLDAPSMTPSATYLRGLKSGITGSNLVEADLTRPSTPLPPSDTPVTVLPVYRQCPANNGLPCAGAMNSSNLNLEPSSLNIESHHPSITAASKTNAIYPPGPKDMMEPEKNVVQNPSLPLSSAENTKTGEADFAIASTTRSVLHMESSKISDHSPSPFAADPIKTSAINPHGSTTNTDRRSSMLMDPAGHIIADIGATAPLSLVNTTLSAAQGTQSTVSLTGAVKIDGAFPSVRAVATTTSSVLGASASLGQPSRAKTDFTHPSPVPSAISKSGDYPRGSASSLLLPNTHLLTPRRSAQFVVGTGTKPLYPPVLSPTLSQPAASVKSDSTRSPIVSVFGGKNIGDRERLMPVINLKQPSTVKTDVDLLSAAEGSQKLPAVFPSSTVTSSKSSSRYAKNDTVGQRFPHVSMGHPGDTKTDVRKQKSPKAKKHGFHLFSGKKVVSTSSPKVNADADDDENSATNLNRTRHLSMSPRKSIVGDTLNSSIPMSSSVDVPNLKSTVTTSNSVVKDAWKVPAVGTTRSGGSTMGVPTTKSAIIMPAGSSRPGRHVSIAPPNPVILFEDLSSTGSFENYDKSANRQLPHPSGVSNQLLTNRQASLGVLAGTRSNFLAPRTKILMPEALQQPSSINDTMMRNHLLAPPAAFRPKEPNVAGIRAGLRGLPLDTSMYITPQVKHALSPVAMSFHSPGDDKAPLSGGTSERKRATPQTTPRLSTEPATDTSRQTSASSRPKEVSKLTVSEFKADDLFAAFSPRRDAFGRKRNK